MGNIKTKHKWYLAVMTLLVAAFAARLLMKGTYLWLGEASVDDAWDRKVKELCEKDGGLKIFETTYISPTLFKKLAGDKGEISIHPKLTAAANAPFFSETQETILYRQTGKVKFAGIQRLETRYLRRDENKILAINVFYQNLGVNRATERPAFFGQCAFPQQGLTKQFIQVQGANNAHE